MRHPSITSMDWKNLHPNRRDLFAQRRTKQLRKAHMTPVEKPVSRKTLSKQVYQYLKQAIILQEKPEFRMGAQLNEVELARVIGCSTTPIREALNMLRRDGLVVGASFHASCVASYRFEDVENMVYVRKTLEIAGLRQAFPHITDKDITFLRRNTETYERVYAALDFTRIAESNQEFHSRIMQRSGNALLQTMLQSITEQAAMIRAPMVMHQKKSPPAGKASAVGEHAGIVDAIEAGDLELAVERLGAHIDRMQRDLCAFYTQHPQEL